MRESGFKEGGGAGRRRRKRWGIGKIDHRVEKRKTPLKILSLRGKSHQVTSHDREAQEKRRAASRVRSRISEPIAQKNNNNPFTVPGSASGLLWAPTCAAGGGFYSNLVTVAVTGHGDGNESRERRRKRQE